MENVSDPNHAEAGSADASTIVGLSFDDPFRAQEFQVAAVGLVSKHEIELLDLVTIVKNAEGKTHVAESIDPSPGKSALSGGLWAGLFGSLLGGPIGLAAGVAVGALSGAVAAKVIDLGLPDAWIAWFRDAVQPNTTTVVLMLGATDVPALLTELERFAGARLVYANVAPDLIARIRDAIGDPNTGPLTQDPDAADAGGSTDASAPRTDTSPATDGV